jgi:hypothetical protein
VRLKNWLRSKRPICHTGLIHTAEQFQERTEKFFSLRKAIIITTNYTRDELIKRSRSEATAYAVRRLPDYCDTIALD